MAEAFDPNDVEKFLPAIGAIAARVGGSAVVQGAKKVAVEGAKRAKKVAAAGAEAAKTGAGKVAEKATQAASAAKEGIKAAPGKAKELREAAQQSGAGKKFNAALEQAKEFKESDKYKNLQAAKEQVDAQRQRAQQQKDAQVERASQAARGAASTGQAFNKAWDALRKEVVDVSGQHAEVGDPRFWNVMSEFGTRDPKTIGQEFAPYDIDELTALAPQVDELLASYGYTPYYFGGRFPMPDLSKRNYNTGHLAIFDPGVREAGFVDPDFTDNWRKVHELGHALGYEDLNAQWGEGRRLGKLGVRTPREMLRAVDWESRALQNQRKLMDEIGLNVKPEQYNRDWNTTIGDAGYRAITGKFTSPEQEGFVPFSDRRVPVDVAMQKVRDRAEELGLDMDQTLRDKRGGARKIASEPMDLAWRMLKMGEEYHPSVEAHMEARQGRYKPVSRMPRTDEPEVSTDEGIDYKTRGQGAIPQGEPIREVTRPLGELHSSFMPVGGHAHERVTDADRVVDAKEQQEVQDRIMQEMAKYVDSNGMYHPDVPREFAIRTHVFDHYRQPDPFYSKSNGDSIVGIVRPHPDNPRRPQVHTVMLRRTGQPLTKDKLRVQKVIDAAPKKSKVRKSVLIKERKSPEAMRHKREYDAAYNKRPDQVKYREELNRERRRRGIMGSHDHMDVSHTQGGRLTLEPEHSNRARHFKDKGTLRVMKSIRDDIEMLRNLLGGPLDEQDGKIAQAMLGMMDEREAMEAEEKPPTLGHAHFDHHGFS